MQCTNVRDFRFGAFSLCEVSQYRPGKTPYLDIFHAVSNGYTLPTA